LKRRATDFGAVWTTESFAGVVESRIACADAVGTTASAVTSTAARQLARILIRSFFFESGRLLGCGP
jgi:hypothetical protein